MIRRFRIRRLSITLLRQGGRERGDMNADFALIFPLFAMMIFAIIQGAIWYDAGNSAQAAANVALNEARAYGASEPAGTEAAYDFIENNASNLLDANVTVTRTATEVTVTVTGRTNSIFANLFNSPIERTAIAPVERWVG